MRRRLIALTLIAATGGVATCIVFARRAAPAPPLTFTASVLDGETDRVLDAAPARTPPAPLDSPAPLPIARDDRAGEPEAQAPPSSTPDDPAPAKPKAASKPRKSRGKGQTSGEVEKPIERQALALVGVDPLAEAVWLDAINSPEVSAHDRSDLIEDLNEEGFANPRRPTYEELPIILNRLAIIEQHAPFAMDDVNSAAFAEAYKDLVNMYAKVMSQ